MIQVRTVLRALVRFLMAMTSKARWVILAYVITRLIAVVVMMKLEGWKPLEAYWWGEVSSLTIGYGDYAPKTTAGRLIAGPFQFFWVYYCGLALGAHIIKFLFRNIHVLTHQEQEWLFHVLSVVFDWGRWTVMSLQRIAKEQGIRLEPIPHLTADGSPIVCPPQPSDTDYDIATDHP